MVRVLLAEDVRILREALVAVLNLADDITVVEAVETGDAVVPAALRSHPDVAVLDIEMPGLDGISAAALLCQWLPACRTLILTGVARPGTLHRAQAAGVAGFMVKESRPEDLIDAVRTVAAGGRVIDPQLAFAALGATASPLTERERDVLRFTASGAELVEVASALNLSSGTVRNYLATAVTKLGARNRVDAIRIATEAGWI
ncbi:response regulator transcription factor [Cryptosporangium arvum]|uniref:Response regulator containing a CheY-like receiver domain and an HTH DNA-binding domain n=1 Tax=Cryptosporangium arvum DSM 44712 TaxID=927661 RepID=A0A011AL50_9ACTN|nr:response regulator transcription factor [Cryptosporangium arvum]EXG82676.1 response regulator containing a CheY-like receiver domain and an HTH DNA-binding domain [Cryptosporangium arvum DSM 44712]